MQTPTWTSDAAAEGSQIAEMSQPAAGGSQIAETSQPAAGGSQIAETSQPEVQDEVDLDLPATQEAIMFMKTGRLEPEPKKKVPKRSSANRIPPFNSQMYRERCQHCKTCKDCNDWADGVEKNHKRSYWRQYRIIKRAEAAFAVMIKFVREFQSLKAALSK